MATLAEFTVKPDAFPLGNLFDQFPNATVEIERIVPTSNAIMPYIWVEGPSGEEACKQLLKDPQIQSTECIDTIESRSLLRCQYVPAFEGVLKAIVDTEVTLLSAVGTQQGWTLEIRGIEQEAITEFDEVCRSNDVPLTLKGLHDLSTDEEPTAELTPLQREGLVLAYEMGYFDEPRQTTLEEIAAELEISRQAVAKRLQRGYRTLIRTYVLN